MGQKGGEVSTKNALLMALSVLEIGGSQFRMMLKKSGEVIRLFKTQ